MRFLVQSSEYSCEVLDRRIERFTQEELPQLLLQVTGCECTSSSVQTCEADFQQFVEARIKKLTEVTMF